MTLENPSQEDSETTRSSTPNEKPSQSYPSLSSAPAGFQQSPDAPSHNAGRQESGERNWRENVRLGLEIIGLIALIVYTFFAGYQWRVANATLTEIRNGKVDTNRIIKASETQASAAEQIADASRRNAAAAESFSKSADEIREETARAVSELRRSANDSETAMKENSRNAQNAMNTSIEASRLDERAWLAISDPEILQYDPNDPTKPFLIQILVRNSGKTPAQQINALGVIQAYDPKTDGPTDDDWKVFLGYFNESKERYVIAPNATRKIIVPDFSNKAQNPPFHDFIAQNYPLIRDRSKYLYYFGQATYIDIDNRPHTTKFCVWLVDPGTKQFAFCGKGNDMD
jgi:hypothetical protein